MDANTDKGRAMKLYTLNKRGIVAELRRLPQELPNGKWRLEYASGLVELRESEPRTWVSLPELATLAPEEHAPEPWQGSTPPIC